jgi:hypothetical protein
LNRRNYYRLLHVQADAPAEVIKAAYRALMALRHPDHGGAHDEAVLLNEAWQVLGDADRRAAYDAQRAARAADKAGARRGRTRADSFDTARGAAATDAGPQVSDMAGHCAFCAEVIATNDLRCVRCQAPLTRMANTRNLAQDRAGERRRLPRVTRSDWGLLRTHWQAEPLDVRMRNLSLEGLSLFSGVALAPHQRVRVSGAMFDAVVQVVSSVRHGNVFVVHGSFVTALFAKPTGGFVHAHA